MVASEYLPPFLIREDDQGLYQELIKRVYRDYKVEFILSDYDTSRRLVEKGQADIWLGSYLNESEHALYPVEPMDADRIVAFSLPKPWPEKQLLAWINTQKVGWLKGYELEDFIAGLKPAHYLLNDIETGFRLLENGRLDVLLQDKTVLQNYLISSGQMNKNLVIKELHRIQLYPGFAKQAKSKLLIKIWDQQMLKMKISGALKALFDSYHIDYLLEAQDESSDLH